MQRGLILRKWRGGDVGIRTQGSLLYVLDDFAAQGSNASGAIGQLGWNFGNGTSTFPATVAGRPGIWQRSTSATINTVASSYLFNVANWVAPAETFDYIWIARTSSIDSAANTQLRFGLQAGTGDPSANGIYFEKLGTDTDFFTVTRASSTQTRTDTTVAYGNSTWFTFRARRLDSSTIRFNINSGSNIDHTANIPTADISPVAQAKNLSAVAVVIDMDYFDLLITGLSR